MSDIMLQRLTFQMAADLAQLRKDMGSAKDVVSGAVGEMKGHLNTLRNAFVAVGSALLLDKLAGMVTGVYAAGAAMHDLSIKTGASVEALSGFNSVGKLTGTSADSIGDAMNRMAKNLAVANEESKGSGQALAALGINFDDFQRMSPDQKMLLVAKAMDQFKDGSDKSALAMALFGKQGAQLLPFLKDLAVAGELHAKITTAQAAQSKDFEVTLKRLQVSGEAWKKELALGMLPALGDTAKAVLQMTNETGGLRDIIKGLAADGTLDAWTRGAIKGFSYLLDAGQYVVRIINAIGRTIYEVNMAAMAGFTGLGNALDKALHGDFKGAAAELSAGFAEMKQRTIDVGDVLAGVFGEETLGAKLRARMDDQERLRNSTDAAGEAAKKADLHFVVGAAKAKEEVDKQWNAYVNLIATLQQKIDTNKQETAAGRELTEAEKQRLEIQKLVDNETIKASDASSARTVRMLEELDTTQRVKDATLEAAKAWEAAVKSGNAATDGLDAQIAAAKQANAEIGKSAVQVAAMRAQQGLAAADTDDATAALLRQAAVAAGPMHDTYVQMATDLEAAAAKKRELVGMQVDAAQLQTLADAAKKAQEAWDTADKRIEEGLYGAVTRGGDSGIKKLIADLKNWAAHLVLNPIIQPIGQFGASLLNPGAPQASSSGAGALGSTAASVGISSMFGAGGLGGAMAGGAGWLTGATTLGGSLSAAGSLIGAGGAGIMPGLAMGAGALAPFVIGAMLVMSMLKKGGGPKQDGSAGYTGLGSDNGGANDKAAQSAVAGMTAAYSSFLQSVGGKAAAGLAFGSGFSTDPKGTAPTFVASSVKVAGQEKFYDLNRNVGRDDASMQAELQLQAQRAVLAALQASALPPQIASYLGKLDPLTANSDEIAQAMQVTQDVGALFQAVDALGAPFTAVRDLSVDSADGLIKLAGGLQNLTQQMAGYFQNYYTAQEQQQRQAANISKALTGAGINVSPAQVMAATREQFRQLMEQSLALGAAGNAAVAVLLSVQQAFADLHPVADATAAAVDNAAGVLGGLGSAADLAALAVAGLQQRLQQAQAGANEAMAALKRAVDAEKAQVQQQISTTQATISKLQSIFGTLDTAVRQLYGQTDSTRQYMAAQGQATIDRALATGNLPSQADLQAAISAVQQDIGQQTYATQFDQDRAQLVLAGKLAALRDMAGGQLVKAQDQLQVQQDQLTALDNQLAAAQAQLDAINGVDTSVISVREAIDRLAAALLALKAAQAGAAKEQWVDTPQGKVWQSTGGATGMQNAGGDGYTVHTIDGGSYSGAAVQQYVQNQLAAGNAVGVYQQAIAKGISANSLDAIMGWSPGTSNGAARAQGLPSFAVGTNYVPRNMVAQLHEGEAVQPRAYNPAAGGVGASDKHLLRIAAGIDALATTSAKQGKALQVLEDAFSGRQKIPLVVDQI